MWQPNWNENQTVLGTVIYTPDKYAGILEITVVGSWSLGIVEQRQGRDGQRGCEGGDCGGKCL